MDRIRYYFAKLMLKIQIAAIKESKVHATSRVCSKCHIYKSTIDAYTYVGYGCNIYNTRIGKFCSIAEDCFFGGAMHQVEYVSTSPVFNKEKNIMGINFAEHNEVTPKGINIGNDVWIGAKVLIKDGITIGDGAVIGMGAVVTKDVQPYEIVGGVPAKKIKNRFDAQISAILCDVKWWDWDEKKIKEHAAYFNDVHEFIKAVKKD